MCFSQKNKTVEITSLLNKYLGFCSLLGLACSDLMFLTLCVPFTAVDYAVPIWIFPRWTCHLINYLQVGISFARKCMIELIYFFILHTQVKSLQSNITKILLYIE